ncbi:MAG: ABC-F family ATP-binding cassette domain-containing protein [Clostridia bacterium]|nr:ABC-F family ATP-binding cassette domain-containing protein [Clostridia bacterium]
MRLYLDDISVSFGANEVLKNITFEVNTKDKVAIVGRNGSGKTTLLKVITGEQEIDLDSQTKLKDKIQKNGNFQIGFLKQIAFEDDTVTFEEEILKAYKNVIEMKLQIDTLEQRMQSDCTQNDVLKYEKLLSRYEMEGGYTYQKEYNTAIKKFGFTEEDKKKKICEFSGGQRTKIALIKLLLSKPDLLILDEPTNHLDITSIEWLEEYLSGYQKAIIVVSHDRAFLDKFVNVVYEIERNKIKKYIGNYTKFIQTKELNYEKDLKDYKSHKEEKERLQALADRFRYKATKAKMAQSKLKQIERMGELDKPETADTRAFGMDLKPRIESGNEVLSANNIEIGYDTVLSKLSFKVFKGDRYGVIGGNGLGKSTLLKSIVEKVPLKKGVIRFGTNVEIGYFDQQTATSNIEDQTILDNFLECFPEEDTQNARNILGMFCFSQDDVFKNIRDLSGGERVRLQLCKILKNRPNLLILDEPTNHMDIVGREALEKMLERFEGTIIFVSHDRYFVNKIANNLIVFENGESQVYKDTTYAEYERMQKEKAQEIEETNKIVSKPEKVQEKPQPKENLYLKNKEKARLEAKRKKLERNIETLETEITELNNLIVSPEVCSDYIKIMEYQEIIDEKSKTLEKFMEEWLEITEND